MKKFILKRRSFEISPYNHDVHVIFTNDLRRAAKRLANELGEDVTERIVENMHAFTVYTDGHSDVHIFFELKPDIGTIVHEIYHAVDFVLRDVRIKPESNVTDEVWAYHLGDLTRNVVKFYLQVNSNKKFNTSNRAK